jgi:acetyltransferase-like isoleucine patch superfamily enzyme
MFDLYRRLSELMYFQNSELPNLETDYDLFDLSDHSNMDALVQRLGISMTCNDCGNRIFLHRNAIRPPHPTTMSFHGGDNTVIIDENCGFHGSVTFEGCNNLFIVFGGQARAGLGVTLYSHDTLVWGRGSFAWGILIWVQGGSICTIGDECLFSTDIIIRTTDHHSIIDLQSLERINAPQDVTIGRHVWVGQDCAISKGATIGDGAIIGTRSLVTSAVPKAELWAGSPARMLRRNVSWVPSHPDANPDEVAALCRLLAISPPDGNTR